ncbi:SIMPL domain-containing protein [Bdellovibrio reynosensis]|uniref:SIMPL domain-containing protein n=1 Tax=Bdellovibrio reynosensis TaxID=2835041 RepID=A0ABY4C964_9BACT|nr:SIMPL domain-containing protein [Bdellovibrio reynosensis]UOF01413.1 SIMPL domain-containing protein [Bdellovibrio reynosensis]
MNKLLIAALTVSFLVVGQAQAEDRFIVVNGVAEKSLDPNMVTMTVEVWSKAVTAKQAQQMAAQQFKLIKKSFEDFKIRKEDIQTENYSLNPEMVWDDKSRTNKMTGFRVSQALSVTVRKIEDTGNFIDSLVADKGTKDAGVNINNIFWDSDKRQEAETLALADAVQAAKTKAQEIAKAAGVKIKGVSKISHSTAPVQPIQPFRGMMKASYDAASTSTEMSAGQIKVKVEVTSEYEI